jgi:hypothetical protein
VCRDGSRRRGSLEGNLPRFRMARRRLGGSGLHGHAVGVSPWNRIEMNSVTPPTKPPAPTPPRLRQLFTLDTWGSGLCWPRANGEQGRAGEARAKGIYYAWLGAGGVAVVEGELTHASQLPPLALAQGGISGSPIRAVPGKPSPESAESRRSETSLLSPPAQEPPASEHTTQGGQPKHTRLGDDYCGKLNIVKHRSIIWQSGEP